MPKQKNYNNYPKRKNNYDDDKSDHDSKGAEEEPEEEDKGYKMHPNLKALAGQLEAVNAQTAAAFNEGKNFMDYPKRF